MVAERRRQILLAALAVTLAVVVYVEWPRTADQARTQNGVKGATRGSSPSNGVTAPDVHLKSLGEEHTKPGEVERNLFRFRTKPPYNPKPGNSGRR